MFYSARILRGKQGRSSVRRTVFILLCQTDPTGDELTTDVTLYWGEAIQTAKNQRIGNLISSVVLEVCLFCESARREDNVASSCFRKGG